MAVGQRHRGTAAPGRAARTTLHALVSAAIIRAERAINTETPSAAIGLQMPVSPRRHAPTPAALGRAHRRHQRAGLRADCHRLHP
ncbi:phthiocerol/phthiodiolone dimycocerosyl transferase family protein [Nocardia acidivorans]|uniref:phthiocerol/phthiodiolone dimycocerosyl transferase family protein n=1 Tax=Nocardia acidivorans TaxID=404580 RepID=UPI0035A22F26